MLMGCFFGVWVGDKTLVVGIGLLRRRRLAA